MNDQKEPVTEDKYLLGIGGVEDLRRLPDEAMPELAEEIRRFLVEKTETHGGHLASNLGVVELTLAIHRVFNTPTDRVIWDVGHQCYVHKILTGRRDVFDTLRRPGGLSGFPRREESEFDPFGTGHSSTSVSAAAGMAQADLLRGERRHTVAVIGDGAMTGGMAHEALNSCGKNLPLIVILNENEMSIAPTTGGFPRLVSRLRISRKYRRIKRSTRGVLLHLPLVGKPLFRLISGIKWRIRNLLYQTNYFEEMGFLYMGPYDGNDYAVVKKALLVAKEKERSVVLHLRTVKGKGYAPAEAMPDEYHCLYPNSTGEEKFHQTFGKELLNMAETDENICAVTPATGYTTGLKAFGEKYPKRLFDVGIAEGHALTYAAGLAAVGMKPYAVIYSSFLQRGYDQLIHDIGLQNLPVRIMIDRASLAPADGPTHHGVYDVPLLLQVPKMQIFAPATFGSLRAILRDTANVQSPVAIRYANTGEDEALCQAFYPDGDYRGYGIRCAGEMGEGCQGLFISYGKAASRTWQACQTLRDRGVKCGMVLLERLSDPGDLVEKIHALVPMGTPTVFVEEGLMAGGLGMHLNSAGLDCRVLAIEDATKHPAGDCDLYRFMGISGGDILSAMEGMLS